MNLMERLQRVRKGGLTFAPEAGTQRLRDAINKNLREEDLLQSCRTAFAGRWSGVKLYFMLGLPTETDEDVLGIADLARKVYFAWREYTPNPKRGGADHGVHLLVRAQAPTAFQWEAQIPVEEYQRRVGLLRDALKQDKSITYNWHDPRPVIWRLSSPGGPPPGRRVGVGLAAWGQVRLLEQYFDYQRWMDALEACGLDGDFYAHRERPRSRCFPGAASTPW